MTGNILLIDDEEGLRKLLSRVISLEGFSVMEAGSIQSGLSVLQRKQIDVILCDVKLPDGNGLDFVKEAKAKFPLIEIILLTAYATISDGVRALRMAPLIISSRETKMTGSFLYCTKRWIKC